jgi:YD repeat-containing protein
LARPIRLNLPQYRVPLNYKKSKFSHAGYQSDYDSNGKVRFATDAENKVTEYRYDANGNQIAVIDARTNKTDYRYDSKGQLVETIYPDNTLANLADNPRTINIYDKGGRLRATVDRSLQVTHYNYDDAGRLVETIYPDGVDTLAQLIQAVAPNQTPATIDWTQVVYPDVSPAFLSNNSRSKTEYYKNGDVKAEIDELGNRTEYRYDNNGRLVEVIYPDDTPNTLADNPRTKTEYDDSGRTVASIDGLGRITRYEYDDLGRLVKTIYPDATSTNLDNNPTTKTEYDSLGRRISATDAAGKTVKYEYDAFGRLTAVVQSLNQSGTNPINLRTEYGYDEAGRLIWQKDAESQQTDFEYDKNGRRVAVELPLTQRSITTYDEVGNVKTVTDFNGDTITYNYDAENRLSSKLFAPGSGETPVTFTYISLHKYVYGNANPVTYTDPTGLFSAGEAQAAADIANTLAGIQWESGQRLIGATIGDNNPSPLSVGIDTLFALGVALATSGYFVRVFASALSRRRSIISSFIKTNRLNVVGQCDTCAAELKSFLRENKVKGRHVRLETPKGSKGFDKYIYDDQTGEMVSNNGFHEAIIVKIGDEDIVFDNFYPDGKEMSQWLRDLYTRVPLNIVSDQKF